MMKPAPQGQSGNSIEALLRMALDRSPSSRNALARSVADICLEEGAKLSEREIELTFDILHTLVRSVEMRVRRDLAQRLAPRRDVPRDLIVTLANDQIDVAYPILVESEVLEESDLIAVTRAQKASHQIAITLRERVSPDVSAALVATNNLDVIDSLMRNPAAEIAPVTMRWLVEMSRDAAPLRRPLLQRQDLDPALARQMTGWVGEALKEFINKNYPLELDKVELDIDESVRVAAAESKAGAMRDLSDQLEAAEKAGGITADKLIRTLHADDLELFEAMFARLTGIDSVAMPVLVYDPGGEPFAIACKACGISRDAFERLYLLLTTTLAGEQDADSEEFKRIRAYYKKLDDTDARSILDDWRRTPSSAWETAQVP
jgi:uncharacterized protein (DUF2336 family)